jgi:protein subunit release factor B
MRLDEKFDVREEKIASLRGRILRLGIDLSRVEECFARGAGKGGQKTNKTSNRVILRYAPLGIVVRCRRERRRSLNRFLALRELVDRAEAVLSPETSARLIGFERERRRKARRRRRSAGKYPA